MQLGSKYPMSLAPTIGPCAAQFTLPLSGEPLAAHAPTLAHYILSKKTTLFHQSDGIYLSMPNVSENNKKHLLSKQKPARQTKNRDFQKKSCQI